MILVHTQMREPLFYLFLTELLEGKLIKDFFRDSIGDVKIMVENIRMKGYLGGFNSKKDTLCMRREGVTIMLIGNICGGN